MLKEDCRWALTLKISSDLRSSKTTLSSATHTRITVASAGIETLSLRARTGFGNKEGAECSRGLLVILSSCDMMLAAQRHHPESRYQAISLLSHAETHSTT
jgi:hypothetical protein